MTAYGRSALNNGLTPDLDIWVEVNIRLQDDPGTDPGCFGIHQFNPGREMTVQDPVSHPPAGLGKLEGIIDAREVIGGLPTFCFHREPSCGKKR